MENEADFWHILPGEGLFIGIIWELKNINLSQLCELTSLYSSRECYLRSS